MPGSGIEDDTNGPPRNSPTKSKSNNFETMILTTLKDINASIMSNMEKLISQFTTANRSDKSIALAKNISDTLSAIDQLEDRKCKLELEINTLSNESERNKKCIIIEKLDSKMEELYSCM